MPEFSYVTSGFSTTDGTSFTFSGVNIGVADSDRTVVVGIFGFHSDEAFISNCFPTSVSVGGVSATEHPVVGGYPTPNRANVPTVWTADVPTGTTADIVVTFPGTVQSAGYAVYRAVGLVPLDTQVDWVSGDGLGVNISTVSGGATIALLGAVNTDLDQETDLTVPAEFGTRDFFFDIDVADDTLGYSIASEDATETAAYSFTVPGFRTQLTVFSMEPTGSGTQTITGSAYTDADTFGAGTVSPGAVTVTGSAFSEADVFTAGVVAAFFTITGAAFSDADAFGTGTAAPGAVTISGAAYSDGDTFGAGTVSEGGVITGATYADPDAFGSGIVTAGAVTITGASYSDSDAFGSGVIGLVLSGTAFSDADSFGSGSLSVGATTITGVVYTDPDSFGSGTVTGGALRRRNATEGQSKTFVTGTAGRSFASGANGRSWAK